MSGIRAIEEKLIGEFERRLPWQSKTQRGNLALLVATTLEVRSANLMDIAAALPREAGRTDMRYQWIVRVLGNRLIDAAAIMMPFVTEVLARAAADRHGVELILDQSTISGRHQVLMLALRHGERALPLGWRVVTLQETIDFDIQKALLDAVAPSMPPGARVRLIGDRFHGTVDLMSLCQERGWDYQLRLKGNVTVKDLYGRIKAVQLDKGDIVHLEDVEFNAGFAKTHIGIIRDPGQEQPWIVAMSKKPEAPLKLDHSERGRIESMFSDFNSRDFGIEKTQIQYPDRLGRLLLVMALAIHRSG